MTWPVTSCYTAQQKLILWFHRVKTTTQTIVHHHNMPCASSKPSSAQLSHVTEFVCVRKRENCVKMKVKDVWEKQTENMWGSQTVVHTDRRTEGRGCKIMWQRIDWSSQKKKTRGGWARSVRWRLPVGSNSLQVREVLSLLGFLSGGWSLLRMLLVLEEEKRQWKRDETKTT